MVKHVFLGLTAAVMKLKHLPGFTRCSFAVALNLALLPSCVVSRMFACASHQEQKKTLAALRQSQLLGNSDTPALPWLHSKDYWRLRLCQAKPASDLIGRNTQPTRVQSARPQHRQTLSC